MNTTGYLDGAYARALATFGTPRCLPAAGGWVLERKLSNSAARDAMGCYPLFACERWQALGEDIRALAQDGLLSLTLVTDPFGAWTPEGLSSVFDRARLFKQHFVYDLADPREETVARNHRRNARLCLRKATIEVAADPTAHVDEWTRLYGFLIQRHALTGIKAFSRASFAEQLAVPGTTLLRTLVEGRAVAAQIWYTQGDAAYSHLTVGDPDSYQLNASYGLYWTALEHFHGKVRYLDLGAGAGATADSEDGLSVFKRGWTRHTRPVYLCGTVLDRAAYDEATRARGTADSSYFPAYRHGELI